MWTKSASIALNSVETLRTISTKTTENKQVTVYNKEDLDLDRFDNSSKVELDQALNKTLQNIKYKLGYACNPTVIWSGHGYHIYQPAEPFVLEQEVQFAKFDQPSRRLIQFAEQHLSDNKSDPCHSFVMSFNNCMLRIPGSYNAKSKSKSSLEEVRIIRKWDGSFRPSIKPLLFDLYIYLQDLRLKKIIATTQ